jgi:hypothetical protein
MIIYRKSYDLINEPDTHTRLSDAKGNGILDINIIRGYCNFIFHHNAVRPGSMKSFQITADTAKLNKNGRPIVTPNSETIIHIHAETPDSNCPNKTQRDYNRTILDIQASYSFIQAALHEDAMLSNEPVDSAVKRS